MGDGGATTAAPPPPDPVLAPTSGIPSQGAPDNALYPQAPPGSPQTLPANVNTNLLESDLPSTPQIPRTPNGSFMPNTPTFQGYNTPEYTGYTVPQRLGGPGGPGATGPWVGSPGGIQGQPGIGGGPLPQGQPIAGGPGPGQTPPQGAKGGSPSATGQTPAMASSTPISHPGGAQADAGPVGSVGPHGIMAAQGLGLPHELGAYHPGQFAPLATVGQPSQSQPVGTGPASGAKGGGA